MQWKTAVFTTVLLQLLLHIYTSASPLIDKTVSAQKDERIDYRLPGGVTPRHYTVQLDPLIGEPPAIFLGDVQIEVDIGDTNLDTITLHYNDMTIMSVEVIDKDHVAVPVSHIYEPETHFFRISATGSVFTAKEKYTIRITYVGNHRDDMYGFYRSSYKDSSGKTVWLATTQFEPVSARRAFPCFDEPALKATFNFFIKRKEGYGAIFNTPEVGSDPDYHTFKTTPLMSTYLTAFVVSDFISVSSTNNTGKEEFKVWARSNAISQADYSVAVGPPILRAVESYIGMEYDLDKMDEVAVPDFSAGAMENWGLVTYRERLILFDKNYGNAEAKQRIATVIAHEFGHQWFGDLVSPQWWDYLWLNEGFATYFETFATALVEKGWRMEEQFVVRDVQSSLAFDALESTHAMTTSVGSPDSIRAIFDAISYEKGGSVIRMMEHLVTTEIFKAGLKEYLTQRQYNYANDEHLYEAIKSKFVGDANPNNWDLVAIMKSWSDFPGFPLLTITASGNNIIIQQKRFYMNPPTNADNHVWNIPISYTDEDKDFTDTTTKVLMDSNEHTMERPSSASNKWYILNVQVTGFYRVNYDENNWNLLTAYLKSSNFEKIHPTNRAQLLDDALTLARAKVLPYKTALDLTQYLAEETDYIPWYSALNAFSFLNLRLASTEYYYLFKTYVLGLINKAYEELKFEELAEDDHLIKLHRGNILRWACDLDHEHCIRTSRDMFEAADTNPIPADLQTVVYCMAARHGGQQEWDKLWNKYLTSNDASEQTLILGALGCTISQNITNFYLYKTISGNGEIRRQDSSSVFSSVYTKPEGLRLAFNFLRGNYAQVAQFYGTGVSSIISGIAARINDNDLLDEFTQFVTEEDLGAAQAAAERALETAKENLQWVVDNGDQIQSWLTDSVSTTPSTTTASTTTSATTTSATTTPSTTSATTPSTTTASTTTSATTTSATTQVTTSETPTTTPGKASSLSASPIIAIAILSIIYSYVKF